MVKINSLLPFVTNGGWLGHTIKDIENTCKKSKVMNPIDIKFDTNTMTLSESKLKEWIDCL